MSKIYVMPDGMKKELNTMTQIQREIKGIENSVHSVAIGLHITGGAGIKLRAAIRNKEKAIQESREDIGRLQHAGNEIVQSYERTERAIVDPSLKTKATTADGNAKPKWRETVFDGALELLGTGGVVGGVVSGTVKYITGKKKLSDGLDYAKTLVDATHDITSGLSDKDSWKKILFGIGKGKPVGEGNFWARWKTALGKEFGEYGLKDHATTLDKVSTFTKWAGAVLAIGSNAAENYEEFKADGGISNGRFWLETGLESAIDIGGGALVSSAAIALLGAGAPAVVATAVVLWGADALTKWVTKRHGGEEKGLTETVSDAIIDGGGWLIKKAGSAAKGVKNGFAKWKSKFAW